MTLNAEIEKFVRSPEPKTLYHLIGSCVAQGGAEGLAALRRLAEDDYGGIFDAFEFQAPAATSLSDFRDAAPVAGSATRLTPTAPLRPNRRRTQRSRG